MQSHRGLMNNSRESFHTLFHKSSSKKSQTSCASFTKKIRSIRQYLQVYQSNPEAANKWEMKQETLIYRNQLKVSLHLIVSLIKICESKQVQSRKLTQQLCFLRQKIHYLQLKNQNRTQKNTNNENISGQLNKSINTPNKRNNMAFQAEKMLISAKHNQQTSEYKKIINKNEQMLKNTTEENVFLRQQLLAITSRVAQLEETIQQLKKINYNLQKENHHLNSKLGQNQHCRVLNFSPISKTSQQAIDQEISFNHLTFIEKEDQIITLKKELEQFYVQIERLKKQNQDLQQKLGIDQRQDYVALKKEYEQIKNQMSIKVTQIQKYRQLQQQIADIEQLSTKYIEENDYLKQQIKLLKLNIIASKEIDNQTNKWVKCEKCQEYQLQVQNFIQQLQVSEQKCSKQKDKIQKIMNAQRSQRKLWDQIYSEIEEKSF